jgi:hypothetical protein
MSLNPGLRKRSLSWLLKRRSFSKGTSTDLHKSATEDIAKNATGRERSRTLNSEAFELPFWITKDILVLVFQNLALEDLTRLRLVCKNFLKIIDKKCIRVIPVESRRVVHFGNEMRITNFEKRKQVWKKILKERVLCSDSPLYLEIRNWGGETGTLIHLIGAIAQGIQELNTTELKGLRFTGFSNVFEEITPITDLKLGLQSLSLPVTFIPNSKNFLPSSLTRLDLTWTTTFTIQSKFDFSYLENLRTLILNYCPCIHLDVHRFPRSIRNLRIVDFPWLTEIYGLEVLSNLRKLTIVGCPNLADEFRTIPEPLPNLEQLVVGVEIKYLDANEKKKVIDEVKGWDFN